MSKVESARLVPASLNPAISGYAASARLDDWSIDLLHVYRNCTKSERVEWFPLISSA
jgi:hypothetical protein